MIIWTSIDIGLHCLLFCLNKTKISFYISLHFICARFCFAAGNWKLFRLTLLHPPPHSVDPWLECELLSDIERGKEGKRFHCFSFELFLDNDKLLQNDYTREILPDLHNWITPRRSTISISTSNGRKATREEVVCATEGTANGALSELHEKFRV